MQCSVLPISEHDSSGITEQKPEVYKPPHTPTTMIATLDRLLALSRKLHDARVQTDSEPIYVALTLNELQLLKRLADDYLDEAEAITFEGRAHADAA